MRKRLFSKYVCFSTNKAIVPWLTNSQGSQKLLPPRNDLHLFTADVGICVSMSIRNRMVKDLLHAIFLLAGGTFIRIDECQLFFASRNRTSFNYLLLSGIADKLDMFFQLAINTFNSGLTRIEGFTPGIKRMSWPHLGHTTTECSLTSFFSHRCSSLVICCRQKYFWQQLHWKGKMSFCRHNSQCFPRSSNSIENEKKMKLKLKENWRFLEQTAIFYVTTLSWSESASCANSLRRETYFNRHVRKRLYTNRVYFHSRITRRTSITTTITPMRRRMEKERRK